MLMGLRGNDLMLDLRQQQLRFGQRQTQVGYLTETIGPADRHHVETSRRPSIPVSTKRSVHSIHKSPAGNIPDRRNALFMIPQSMDGPCRAIAVNDRPTGCMDQHVEADLFRTARGFVAQEDVVSTGKFPSGKSSTHEYVQHRSVRHTVCPFCATPLPYSPTTSV
jgi:hypothetical protein